LQPAYRERYRLLMATSVILIGASLMFRATLHYPADPQ
jgi:hypothetical protein